MEEMSQTVQNANTHILKRQSHEHAHNSRSVQVPVQGGDGGQVREGSKGKHSHPAMSKSQARAQQSVSSRASSTGRWRKRLGRFKRQTLTHCDAKVMSTRITAGQFKSRFKGAMEEMSGKVQNASTHPLRRYRHEHAHNSWSVQGPVQGLVQWGDGGNV